MYGPLMDVQYLLSTVYNTRGMEKERDDAARRHLATGEQREREESIVADLEVKDILDVVALAGAALSSR